MFSPPQADSGASSSPRLRHRNHYGQSTMIATEFFLPKTTFFFKDALFKDSKITYCVVGGMR